MSPPAKKQSLNPALAQRFVANVEQLMDLRKWTYAELATRMGVERTTVSRMVEGKIAPAADVMGKVAMAFGVSVAELVRKPGATPAKPKKQKLKTAYPLHQANPDRKEADR